MSVPRKPGGKALDVLQNLPRITLGNLRPEPGSKTTVRCLIVETNCHYLQALVS